ncbi:MAG: hypothetical protein E7K18_07215 [Anaerococcus vaginalis]|uniref:hypothetical protein n=1 Tax=Anaerococcus vaginalis TaxID=33037 RepID=UPI002911CFAD|nr:hypothetical protein [Anaerococcus vaginalis]MDU6182683.1 hypothetical protein [Anaerococcus vaginalis]MDU7433460.1 hypothetical protein [Anaerococcus vaginalis]MDU7650738.1 hypothetical protein [Anaerococcus vaginalis]
MKKSKKILFLALSMSLAFSPINSMISNKANVAYAEEMMNEKEELSPEEFIQKAKDFVNSEEFKQYTKEGQDAYKKLIEDLKVENVEEKKEEISKSIDSIKLTYIKKQYEDLKKEVFNLKAESLSDDLKNELASYKEAYDSYKDYEEQIKNLKTTKSNIENYNKKLEEFKKILKDGLEKYKNFGIDLKAEKLVLDDANSNLEKVEEAIENLNNKAKIEENRQANLKTLKEIIDGEVKTKSEYFYKKSDESLKNNFNKSLDAIKKAYSKLQNKEEVNSIDNLVKSYNTAYNNLNGDKFMAERQKLIDYFEKNKGKLSSSNQKKYADLINGLPDKADSNLDSIKKLKAEIEKAIEENQQKGKLSKVSRKVAVKKQPATKKSRSFVRTGVKSVGIVLVVLILAGAGYFLLSKKSKK